jgi:hypothetical protein
MILAGVIRMNMKRRFHILQDKMKFWKKFFKNLLTNPLFCDIIYTTRGEHPKERKR